MHRSFRVEAAVERRVVKGGLARRGAIDPVSGGGALRSATHPSVRVEAAFERRVGEAWRDGGLSTRFPGGALRSATPPSVRVEAAFEKRVGGPGATRVYRRGIGRRVGEGSGLCRRAFRIRCGGWRAEIRGPDASPLHPRPTGSRRSEMRRAGSGGRASDLRAAWRRRASLRSDTEPVSASRPRTCRGCPALRRRRHRALRR